MRPQMSIPGSQNALMQIIKLKVSRGYRYHQSGEIPITKAVALAEKFEAKFEWSADRVRRQFLKRRGLANTFLYFYPTKNLDTLYWFLLANDGEHPMTEKDSFKDQFDHKQSIYFADRYRLEHFQRENICGGGRRYTWMIAPNRLKEYEASINELCSRPSGRGTYELIKLFAGFEKMPLSHGITHNLHQLRNLAKKNWRLNADFPIPEIKRNYNDFGTRLFDDPPLTLELLIANLLKKIEAAKAQQVDIAQLVSAE